MNKISEKIAYKIVDAKDSEKVIVDVLNIEDYIGHPMYKSSRFYSNLAPPVRNIFPSLLSIGCWNRTSVQWVWREHPVHWIVSWVWSPRKRIPQGHRKSRGCDERKLNDCPNIRSKLHEAKEWNQRTLIPWEQRHPYSFPRRSSEKGWTICRMCNHNSSLESGIRKAHPTGHCNDRWDFPHWKSTANRRSEREDNGCLARRNHKTHLPKAKRERCERIGSKY